MKRKKNRKPKPRKSQTRLTIAEGPGYAVTTTEKGLKELLPLLLKCSKETGLSLKETVQFFMETLHPEIEKAGLPLPPKGKWSIEPELEDVETILTPLTSEKLQ